MFQTTNQRQGQNSDACTESAVETVQEGLENVHYSIFVGKNNAVLIAVVPSNKSVKCDIDMVGSTWLYNRYNQSNYKVYHHEVDVWFTTPVN